MDFWTINHMPAPGKAPIYYGGQHSYTAPIWCTDNTFALRLATEEAAQALALELHMTGEDYYLQQHAGPAAIAA